jgi:vitamin B12 transporter
MRRLFVIIFILISVGLKAQQDTVSLNEVIISSSRTPVIFKDVSRVIMVLTHEEIKQAPVSSINELLDYVMGVDVRQRGAGDVQADVSIRGGSCEQTLILLNGVNVNDPQTGHHNLDLPVNLSSIERIEVLEGAGARIYGPNAFAGAINIITENAGNNKIKATLAGGDFKLFEGNIGTQFKIGPIKNSIDVLHKNSAGYRENTDYDLSGIFVQSSAPTGNGEIQFQSGWQNKAFGANSFYTAKYPNQFEKTRTLFSSLKWTENIGKLHVTPQIYYRRHQDRFELFREDNYVFSNGYYIKNGSDTAKYSPGNYQAWNYYNGHNYHLTHVYGGQVNAWFAWGLGKTSIGAEYRVENILSNVLGEAMNDTLSVPFESNGKFTRKASRENAGIFIDHTFSTQKFNFSAGLLSFWNSDFGMEYYPGADISYLFYKDFRWFGSVSKTLRLPTYTDLYYHDAVNIGNPDLKSEQAMNYETGIKYITEKVSVGISGFYRDGNNIIDWVRLTSNDIWRSANITEVKTQGVEFYGRINLYRIKTNCPITLLQLNYAWINLEKASGNYYSKYALDMLRNKVSLQMDHKIWKNFTAGWRVLYQERMGTYTDYTTGLEKKYHPFLTVDGRLSWKLKSFNFFVQISNIMNADYIDMANIPMPGRWAKAGISMNLNLDKGKK